MTPGLRQTGLDLGRTRRPNKNAVLFIKYGRRSSGGKDHLMTSLLGMDLSIDILVSVLNYRPISHPGEKSELWNCIVRHCKTSNIPSGNIPIGTCT